jgi:type I restriction enzyme M protein
MLNSETKSRIDSARDILVGKVPDPKSQVEQITIALIYKFMDDMDRQSEELGGKASFFTGEFKKYRWAQLLDKRFSGHERLLLYAEGIEKMNVNKNIPQLFRDIFKGVFLPYRDPETLNLFLKEINGFSYDHSERLGDAFEYLLSVLDTQGDAGQFRTPRHIIDFIVAVVDPQKHETVLDPACGTAGFLISSFKHIVRNNESLTPDERARLMTNFRGYDIAPDMVRLSRANLYLHGFANPVIHEYDTLTSEERWDERCDVILANPPFMSPKGGIRPHNRFSIKAKRSEVLFVDYMAEHLNPSGRAGIIVPEGIIFQSQNAYKALRKMLVENYLWAVVSLPAGVFNPYSGVKTSILFLDRNLARRADEVLFVKVESDGFDLGAQRRPIEKNDLPEALQILEGHKKAQKAQEGKMALTVSRKRLLESPDVNLSGDRYREAAAVQSKWPIVELGQVLDYEQPTKYIVSSVNYDDKYTTPVLTAGKTFILGYTNEKNGIFQEKLPVIIFDDFTTAIKFVDFPFKVKSSAMKILHADKSKADIKFLFHIMQRITFPINEHKRYWISEFSKIKIPLPSLAEQERIVAELDGYRKVIEGARQVIAEYRPTIKIDPTWPMLSIGGLCKRIQYGLSSSLNTKGIGYKTFRMNEIVNGIAVDVGQMKYAGISNAEFAKYELAKGDILFNRTNSYEHVGRTGIFLLDGEYAFASYLVRLTLDQQRVNPMFLNLIMNTPDFQQGIKGYASRAIGQANINASSLASYEIPLPPIEIQRQIVAEIEAERALVESNRKLVEIFEKKIQTKLAEIWGENED